MSLKRARQQMPDDIEQTLIEHKLLDVYHSRPDYQQNDYLAWIGRAKREATRRNRLDQMLDELRNGDRYMNMPYRAQ